MARRDPAALRKEERFLADAGRLLAAGAAPPPAAAAAADMPGAAR